MEALRIFFFIILGIAVVILLLVGICFATFSGGGF